MDYNSFNFDQKVTRIMAGHAVKLGFRWSREYGSKTNPQANGFTYNNLDDLLANRASAFLLAMGNPRTRVLDHPVLTRTWGSTGVSCAPGPIDSCSSIQSTTAGRNQNLMDPPPAQYGSERSAIRTTF